MSARPNVLRQLAALRSMPLEDLERRYEEVSGAPPQSHSAAVLRSALAYRIQAAAYGDLEPVEEEALAAAARDSRSPSDGLPSPGTRLVRNWHGVDYEVVLRSDGRVEHAGRIFSSLSAAATAITGTRWNGRAFFNLHKP